jgi:hypothetical protein
MASTYVNDLRLNEMATGDGSGTWGTTTNTNLELIAEAFSYGTEVITTNADTHTTTIADGATDPGRSLYLKYTGTLDSACTITIGPNTVSKVWIIENGTSGSQDIILSQGSGANITIPAGDTKVVYSDGAGAGAAFFDAFANLKVTDPAQTNITSVGTLTGFTSTGIDDNADATAITIDSSENVGIGTASPSRKLHISSSGTDCAIRLDNTVSGRPFLLAYDDSQNLTFTNSSDSGYIAFVNGTGAGTERVRIDSSGNLLVGGTTTTTIPTLNKGIYLVSSTDGDVIGYSLYANEGTNNRRASFFLDDSNGVYGFDTTASSGVCDFVVQSAGTERMRVESGGNLCLGSTTSAAKLRVNYTGESYGLRVGTTATSGVAVQFVYEPSDQVGTITNTTSATAYNTSSDYRLKEDDVPMTGATERVKALRPINFAWKIDGSRVDGFFAHEAQEVVPEAVHGTKDAMRDEEYEVTPAVLDDDGNVVTEAVMGTRSVPDMQGIDHSKLVPLLTAALQEAITKIEDLTTRLETLENA